jgi:hypothetical protein
MMREVYEIDSDGYVIDTYLMTEEQIAEGTSNGRIFVDGWHNQSFYNPKYDFTTQSWVEEAPIENILADMKTHKIKELNIICNQDILQNFQATNGHMYQFTNIDQQNFNQQLSLLLLDNTITEIIWKTEDAGVLIHTRTDFTQVCKDAEVHKKGNISKYWQLKGLVESATTIEELETITWDV